MRKNNYLMILITIYHLYSKHIKSTCIFSAFYAILCLYINFGKCGDISHTVNNCLV